jgi:hypothetical protein
MMRRTHVLTLFALLAGACSAEIGDSCDYDIDCSENMDRNCDGNQPSGYCLILSCDPDDCPSEASCVEFTTPCPDGTAEEMCEQIEENRTRTYCLRHCKKGGDCRSGYQCAMPDGNVLDGVTPVLPVLDNSTIIDLDYNPESQWGICVPEV